MLSYKVLTKYRLFEVYDDGLESIEALISYTYSWGPLTDQPMDAHLSSFPPQWRLRGPLKSTVGAPMIACIHLHLYLDYLINKSILFTYNSIANIFQISNVIRIIYDCRHFRLYIKATILHGIITSALLVNIAAQNIIDLRQIIW